MRVCHVTSGFDPRLGGVVTAVAGLALAQRQAGLEVSVLTTFRGGEDLSVAARLGAQGVEVTTVGPGVTPLVWHRQIAATLQEQAEQCDVMHLHALWEAVHYRAAKVCQRRGVAYVMAPHGMLDPWCLKQSGLRKRAMLALGVRGNLNRAAALHFTTETERRLTQPLELTAPAIVEPNGLDLAEFDALPAAGAFRRRFGQVGARRIVLFLSRLHPKKGLDVLIPAFAGVKAGDAVLVIAGPDEGDYRAEVEAMVRGHTLGDRVVLTGMLQGAARLEAFVDAALFVLPSYQENFGIAVIEALACGTPVVVSDQVNLCDEVRAGGVGAVTPVRAAALAETLERWLGDEGLRQAAAERARGFARGYDWRLIARRWAEHYETLVRKTAGAADKKAG